METVTLKPQKRARFTFHQILEGIEGITIIIICYLTLCLKPLRDRWGLSITESNRALPGDDVIKKPKSQFTHGIEINAPTENVWPWIAQIGQGRGGFYSYEALENLAGLNIFNSDVILPQFQNPKLGDLIPFGPQDAYPLVVCEPGKAMAITHGRNLDTKAYLDTQAPYPKNYFHLTWLWYVEPLGQHRSRFISRNRVTYPISWKHKLIFGLIMEPIIFAMDRKMCYGIKKRAERLNHNLQNSSWPRI